MLPEGFAWIPRWQYNDGELALALDGHQVAMLMRRADGGWVARLEIEAWAIRHEARLRDEVARKVWRVG